MTPAFPQFTSATVWEVLGWNDFAATYNELIKPTTRRRSIRLLHFKELLENFLVESQSNSERYGRCNYWYLSGIELALEVANDQTRDPYSPLPYGEEYQRTVQYTPATPTPCEYCAKPYSIGVCVELLVLYTECFCSVDCAVKYQKKRRKDDRWLRYIDQRIGAPIPEDSSLWPAHFAQVPPLEGTCHFDADYQRKLNEPTSRAQVVQKIRVPSHVPVQDQDHDAKPQEESYFHTPNAR
jgi:hypothetical protein